MGKAIKPTEAELRVLRVLWDHGPQTTAGILALIEPKIAQGSLGSLLSYMLERKLVRSTNNRKPHIYEAMVSREHTVRSLIRHVTSIAFGKPKRPKLVGRHAIDDAPLADDELATLRRLLEDDHNETGK